MNRNHLTSRKTMAYLISLFFSVFLVNIAHADHGDGLFLHQRKSVQSVELTPKEKSWLAKHKLLRIAFDDSLPPYSFINDSGQFEGIAVDIIGALSRNLNIKFKTYSYSNWNELYKAAAVRKVDVVATMVNRPERSFWFNFTLPYIKKSLVIMTTKDNSSVINRSNLSGKKVSLVKGYQYGYQVKKEFPSVKPYFVNTTLNALKLVSNRKVDAAITFMATANYLQNQYQIDDLKFADFYDRNSTDESIAVRKDWPILAAILQKGLDSISEQQMNDIYSKWVAPSKPKMVVQAPSLTSQITPPKHHSPKLNPRSSSLMLLAVILSLLLFLIRRQNNKIKLANHETENAHCTVKQLQCDLQRLIINRSAELNSNENKFRNLVENQSADYFFYQYDCDGVFTYISPSVTNILGYTQDEFMAHYRDYLTDNPENLKIKEYIEKCSQGIPSPPYQIEIYDNKNVCHWLEVNDSPVYDDYGLCIGVDGVMYDITVRKQEADRLLWMSYYDELTGLANRRLFMDRLQQSINFTLRKGLSFSLFFLDLDRFKTVNDTMGHLAGDDVLKEAARRLRSVLRDSDIAARFGGDEFVLLLPDTGKEASILVAKKIIAVLRDTYELDEQGGVNLGVSIGIAVYPDDGKNCEALIKQADSAMYHAKKKSIGFAFVT